MDLACSCLHRAAKKMKKWTDRNRQLVEYHDRDLVLVKLYQNQKLHGMHKGLIHRYEGPFFIIKKVGKVAYKLEISPRL